MKARYILEKILTGRKVEFKEGEITHGGKTGNRVVVLHDMERDKSFIIYASLYNFNKFRRWIGKKAYADYEPMFKVYQTNLGKLACIRLSTEVEIEYEGDYYE